jgi:hypothetical protein
MSRWVYCREYYNLTVTDVSDGISIEEREAEAATLRELQEAIFDLEHGHRIYRRSLARETKYGSK